MTDWKPSVPSPRPAQPPATDSAHPEPAPEGNGLVMPVTLATRAAFHPPTTVDPGDRGRLWLMRLVADEFHFPAIAPAKIPLADRSPVEFDVTTRAAGCRDLFIVHADPVCGERLIVDVARATTHDGADRVLILSPNPAAADRITERLIRFGVPVLRALADDENPVRPSPAVSKQTTGARVEQLRREAAAAVAAAEARLAAFATVAKAVDRLKEVNALLKQREAEIATKTAIRAQIEKDARSSHSATLTAALAKLQVEHNETAAKLTADCEGFSAALKEQEAKLAEMKRAHADLTRKPGFFARLFGAKSKAGTPEALELENQLRSLESNVAALTRQFSESRSKVDAESAAFAEKRQKLIDAEVVARCASVDAELAAAKHEQAHAKLEATALAKAIETQGPADDHADAERQLSSARSHAAEVARSGPELVARALAESRVIVGTPGSLEADPVFGTIPGDPPFGLLVLDRAEELPEPEFERLSRLAERWLLVGDALWHEEPRPPHNGTPPSRASRNGRALEIPFIARLAKLLDRETWTTEGDRLICRLAPLSADQRRVMTREPLADRPEIELRFTASEGDPLLAEISFPAGTTLPAAKSFLFHELGETLLRPCGDYCWHHAPDAITASWPAADSAPESVWIDLEPGVREKVSGTGLFAFTSAVSFDPSAGWDAEKASAWLARYLPPPPTGRFAALPRSASPRV